MFLSIGRAQVEPPPGASEARPIYARFRHLAILCRSTHNNGDRGFSLIESLVALLLVGIALLLATAILNTTSRSAERLKVQGELLQFCEATLETVRSGSMPLKLGSHTVEPVSSNRRVSDLRLSLSCKGTSTPNLYEVTVQARCDVRGESMRRSLKTLVWRP